MLDLDEETREFLIESNENLVSLDREIVELEQQPDNLNLISSVFRTIHTIKGTCGFFSFEILGSLTHVVENILGQVRERQRPLTPELISLVLEAVDEVTAILRRIEKSGSEGEDGTFDLRARLTEAYEQVGQACASDTVDLRDVPDPDGDTALQVHNNTSADKHGRQISSTLLSMPSPAGQETPKADEPLRSEDEAQTAADSMRETQLSESTVRVDVALLNKLLNLVGELVLARNQLLQDASTERSSLQQTSQRLNLITSELQEGVMRTRMQSVGSVWNKLPRVVRDLSSRCGKRVRIEMEGGFTELDKTVLEAIKDPLTHVVRNACDHGIELPEVRVARGKHPEGLLRLRAYHEGGVVNIEVSDDGCGLNPDKLKSKAIEKGLLRPEQAAQLGTQEAFNLIFLPGFSTAAQVTSISGRGVGMDVVKTNIEKIGGTVSIMNRSESGTTIRIKIPLTLAIIPGLVITMQKPHETNNLASRWLRQERFIIPQANLLELVRLEKPDELTRIQQVHSTMVFHHRGTLLPLVYLGHQLGREQVPQKNTVVNIVVLQAENCKLGLVVDEINDTQEIVVKPLGRQLKELACYLGATIMGDGRPALILDVAGLARHAGLALQARHSSFLGDLPVSHTVETRMMLLFRSGVHKQLAVELKEVNRIERIRRKDIEVAGGKQVLNYRGDILPLASMPSVQEIATGISLAGAAEAHVIVFSAGERRFGLLVDEIIDILNEPVDLKQSATSNCLLGSAILAGKITDLIDVRAFAASLGIRGSFATSELMKPILAENLLQEVA